MSFLAGVPMQVVGDCCAGDHIPDSEGLKGGRPPKALCLSYLRRGGGLRTESCPIWATAIRIVCPRSLFNTRCLAPTALPLLKHQSAQNHMIKNPMTLRSPAATEQHFTEAEICDVGRAGPIVPLLT
eukprot:2470687-Pyramimonas_sp.AAC.1